MAGLLYEWVTAAAERRPRARAIVGGDEVLTYAALEARSNRVANVLRALGCARGDRVALLAPTSPTAVACLVGALKAGCIYVPLDPSGPVVRNADALRRCEPRVVLVDGPDARGLVHDLHDRRAFRDARVLWLARGPAPDLPGVAKVDVEAASDVCPDTDVHPDDVAYVLFATDSTGATKGIQATHAGVQALVDWAVYAFDLGPADRLSGHAPLTVDLSTLDVYAAFAAGAELHLVPPGIASSPPDLVGFIREQGLTSWFSTPSTLRLFARFAALDDVELPSLRHVAWDGDVLPTRTLLYWKRRLPGVSFTNLYGPAETTVASSWFRVPEDFDDPGADLPLGVACPGEELLLLDDGHAPVADGEPGVIHIRGVGVSPGYWRDPERTRRSFLEDPTTPGARMFRTGDRGWRGRDGLVHFLGHRDLQIEAPGRSLRASEVERVVLGLGGVAACAVVPLRIAEVVAPTIGCAYVSQNGWIAPRHLHTALSGVLPAEMMPRRWIALDDLPIDDRGKVDRRQIRRLLAG
jgi:amino acid adenylation domain-containing protein